MTAPILAVPASLEAPTPAPLEATGSPWPSLAVWGAVPRRFATLLPVAAAALLSPAHAGPVLCTTTLEAPTASAFATGPVEVTRCGVVRSHPEVMEQRYYSYSAPFAQGINVLHQITDTLGLSIAGRDGSRFVGLGFPDQNIVWDGTAIENTYSVMVSEQSDPLPLRTSDISNNFGGSLGASAATGAYVQESPRTSWTPRIRGLW